MFDRKRHALKMHGRADVAIIGGEWGNAVTWEFGKQTIRVPASSPDRPEAVVLANAYGLSRPDGSEALFLVRSLVPASATEVSVGETIEGAHDFRMTGNPSPAVEMFPMASHPTDVAKRAIAEAITETGRYGEVEPDDLRLAVLVVALRNDREYNLFEVERDLRHRLLRARSGNLASCILNEDGIMTVRVVARVEDVAAAATETALAMDAAARRERVMSGGHKAAYSIRTRPYSDYREPVDMRSIGNMLYSLVPCLLQELPGSPGTVAEAVLPLIRLKALLRENWETLEARSGDGRGGSRTPTLSMHCDTERQRRLAVAIMVRLAKEDGVTLGIESLGKGGDPLLDAVALLSSLGEEIPVLGDVSTLYGIAAEDGADYRLSKLCVAALLGNARGRWLLAKEGVAGASLLLRHAVTATEWGDGTWGSRVAAEAQSLANPVTYAEATIETLSWACDDMDMEEVDSEFLRKGEVPSPDWASLAEEARREYARRKAEAPYGDDDYEYGDDWDSWEGCLADDPGARAISDLCCLVGTCRPALQLLDEMGWAEVLRHLPALRAVIDDDGDILPMRNEMVAVIPEGFLALVDRVMPPHGGLPVEATFPSIVMGDGSVMSLRAEPALMGEGVVGRMSYETAEGKAGECVLLSAASEPFGSVEDLESFVLDLVLAEDDLVPEGE